MSDESNISKVPRVYINTKKIHTFLIDTTSASICLCSSNPGYIVIYSDVDKYLDKYFSQCVLYASK